MTSEPATELHELTARYFDGELEGAQEEAALAHLASCARRPSAFCLASWVQPGSARATTASSAAAAVSGNSSSRSASARFHSACASRGSLVSARSAASSAARG